MLIDDKAKIPLFAVIATLPVLVVTVLWIGTLSSRVTATEERTNRVVDKIQRMDGKEDRILELLTELRERTARIEERLKR